MKRRLIAIGTVIILLLSGGIYLYFSMGSRYEAIKNQIQGSPVGDQKGQPGGIQSVNVLGNEETGKNHSLP